ncbi:MAG: SWIM zinc finger family protein [Elusimicrobia bacterium]|nr:SWIM zinc finger family protein [Elusimicrobiota bacterium]
MGWGFGWQPYVPVWKRRQLAAKQLDRLRKKGANIQPVAIAGREIARTFWGKAWCCHLEKFSDFSNRLPRGRTYVRNGSVCHLDIQKGRIEAKVSGTSLYDVEISIKSLPPMKWKNLRARCAGRVGSMLELLQGRLSSDVMGVVTDKNDGLFPLPREIGLDCSCPDWAEMCKHVAAVLYAVGSRLDYSPELLFLLRGVDHNELVGKDAAKAVVSKSAASKGRILDEAGLHDVFGIDLAHAGRKPGKAAGLGAGADRGIRKASRRR